MHLKEWLLTIYKTTNTYLAHNEAEVVHMHTLEKSCKGASEQSCLHMNTQ